MEALLNKHDGLHGEAGKPVISYIAQEADSSPTPRALPAHPSSPLSTILPMPVVYLSDLPWDLGQIHLVRCQ